MGSVMRNSEMRLFAVAVSSVLMVGCAAVYPSSRLGGPDCGPTPVALARVTYEQVPDHVAIGCAGCPDVYVAAQYQWLASVYPGYTVREHHTAGDLGSQGPAPLLSCFHVDTPDGVSHDVCFADSGWCHEGGSKS